MEVNSIVGVQYLHPHSRRPSALGDSVSRHFVAKAVHTLPRWSCRAHGCYGARYLAPQGQCCSIRSVPALTVCATPDQALHGPADPHFSAFDSFDTLDVRLSPALAAASDPLVHPWHPCPLMGLAGPLPHAGAHAPVPPARLLQRLLRARAPTLAQRRDVVGPPVEVVQPRVHRHGGPV